jgi:hypothetical protein
VADIKNLEHFFEPDPLSQSLAPSLEEQYKNVREHCSLHSGVPEEVRSYFNMISTLWLNGLFYYPFYTLAAIQSTFVVEMALRGRLPPKALNKKGRDMRFLGDLLKEAKDAGLLPDGGFPSLKMRRAHAEALDEIFGSPDESASPESQSPYVDTLIHFLPGIRNSFAHPKIQTIMFPGQALDFLIIASEIINQLWPNAVTDSK